jgi:hypothetical protein
MAVFRGLLLTCVAAIVLTIAIAAAYAEDCSFLKLDPLTLMDRQTYFQDKESLSWNLLSAPMESLANRPTNFAYVFREQFKAGHSGVIVIKSARNRQSSEPQRSPQEKPVQLVRQPDNYCGKRAVFGTGQITAKSYDDYHDQGIRGPEYPTIKSFHAQYVGRGGGCKRTDESGPDSLVDPRSNRGQFSFDPRVASQQTYSQVLAQIGTSTAYASSENLEDQRVEIMQYTTTANMPSCVRFGLPAQKRASFLRVNDLEGLVFKQPMFVRSDEKEWPLVP